MAFTLADLLNSPTEYEFEDEGGKKTVYRMRQASIEECGRYQRWLESEARASAARAVDLPEEDRRNLLRDTNLEIGAQAYAWGGELCVKSLRTPNGFAKLLTIVCEDQGLSYRNALKMAQARLRELAGLVLDLVEAEPEGKALRQLLRSVGLPQGYFATSSSDSATPPTEVPPTSCDSENSALGNSPPSTPHPSGTSTASPS